MDTSVTGLAKFLLPRTPQLLKTALWHTARLSPTSGKWDLRTEIIVAIVRSLLNQDPSKTNISKLQRISLTDPGIKGAMWVSKTTLEAPPEDAVRQVLFDAINALQSDDRDLKYDRPPLQAVEAEWTGHRAGVSKDAAPPSSLSETERYTHLMKEVTSPVTILYFHGGAHYLMDPASHRVTVSRLCKMTGGKALSVRYRLAPVHPFPAALLDAFVAYLSLLSPPPGAPHEPVKPENIVLAGDSAGGNICFALLQLLLTVRRRQQLRPKIQWHGAEIPIGLPAGVATNSAWLDITRSMPSLLTNAKYDYLPPVDQSSHDNFPPCELWPSPPPRADLYCEAELLCHPLVSPLNPKSDWTDAPPLLLLVGEEMLADEIGLVAAKAAEQGVKVRWRGWEAMPHCFAMLLEGSRTSDESFNEWAGFIKGVAEGGDPDEWGGRWRNTEGKVTEVELTSLRTIDDDEVLRLMQESRRRRELGMEGEGKAMPGL